MPERCLLYYIAVWQLYLFLYMSGPNSHLYLTIPVIYVCKDFVCLHSLSFLSLECPNSCSSSFQAHFHIVQFDFIDFHLHWIRFINLHGSIFRRSYWGRYLLHPVWTDWHCVFFLYFSSWFRDLYETWSQRSLYLTWRSGWQDWHSQLQVLWASASSNSVCRGLLLASFFSVTYAFNLVIFFNSSMVLVAFSNCFTNFATTSLRSFNSFMNERQPDVTMLAVLDNISGEDCSLGAVLKSLAKYPHTPHE